jgi:nucleoside-diphosphate-sugar epimerase
MEPSASSPPWPASPELVVAIANERVLVTGGAGVIGREVIRLAGSAGSTLLSIDRLPLPEPPPPGTRHVEADLAMADLSMIDAFRPTVILHLAATFERSQESPDFWQPNWVDNTTVSHRLAELAPSLPDLQALVFASSYLVYDPRAYLRSAPGGSPTVLSERAPLGPRNLCGAAKLYSESEFAFAAGTSRTAFRTAFARIFRVYGRGSRDVISRFVRDALAGEPLDLYRPENRFDYIHAQDVAEGLLRIAAEPAASGAINVSRGQARSIHEVVAAIRAAMPGRTVETRLREIDEPFEASQADLHRLEDVVRWRPSITLEEGIRTLVAHEESSRDPARA